MIYILKDELQLNGKMNEEVYNFSARYTAIINGNKTLSATIGSWKGDPFSPFTHRSKISPYAQCW